MRPLIQKLLRDERGATAIEYGLIAALLSIVVVTGATLAGGSISTKFNFLASALS